MSDRAPYSRVYWAVQDDEKFDGIREDMRLMGSWLTLLLLADQAWPAPAYPPPIVPKSALRALDEAGLVDIMTGGRYRISGLEAERTKRSEKAAGAAAVRWQSERIANDMPSKAETSRDETRRADARGPSSDVDDGRADLEAFLLVNRRPPTPKQRRLLDGLLDRHDLTGPQWAADIILRNPNDPIGAVIAADQAWRNQRIAEAQAAEAPKPTPRRSPGLPQATREILAEMQRQAKEEVA